MQVTALHLQNFRNYADLTLALSPSLNIFLGPNAQGKTNLLEAVYYASLTHSHRTRQDHDLIRFQQPAALLQLAFSRAGVPSRLDIQIPAQGRRKILLNGQPVRPRELIGTLNTVLFSPEDLALIKGAPAGRRRFLDRELSQASPAYYHELLTYNHLLQQRNTLLKEIKEHRASPHLLDPWDPQLAASAAKIAAKRQDAVQKLQTLANTMQQSISGDAETLALAYEFHGAEETPTLASVAAENERTCLEAPADTMNATEAVNPAVSAASDVTRDLELWYNKRLEARRSLDILRGVTSVGPHRDDLALTVNGIDLRAYGSQGQQRTGALALKLAELEFLHEETGEYPILLLDDVMSELDAGRRRALLAFLAREKIQTIITATDAAYFPKERFGTMFHVKDGTIIKDEKSAGTVANV